MLDEIKKEIPNEDSASEEEKMILHDEILKLKPKVIVETGTHRGLTTMYLALAVQKNGIGHIWTADPFEWGASGNFRKFPELEKLITYEQIEGKDLKVEKIDFMFIDGFHEKVVVLEEINALFPHLNDGAVVYFHDTNGSNASCDIPGAVQEAGLKVEQINTLNGMMRYVHNISVNDNNSRKEGSRASEKKSKQTDKK